VTGAGKRQALGRGLAALIPAAAASDPDERAQAKSGSSLRAVDIENIHPSGRQPRKRFDDARLSELAESIRSQGIIQPLVVRVRRQAASNWSQASGDGERPSEQVCTRCR